MLQFPESNIKSMKFLSIICECSQNDIGNESYMDNVQKIKLKMREIVSLFGTFNDIFSLHGLIFNWQMQYWNNRFIFNVFNHKWVNYSDIFVFSIKIRKTKLANLIINVFSNWIFCVECPHSQCFVLCRVFCAIITKHDWDYCSAPMIFRWNVKK